MAIKFNVDLSGSSTRMLKVEMSIPLKKGIKEKISMPVWAPGSYLVRDFSRHISNIYALNGRITQLDKASWEISSEDDVVKIGYEVYCDELSVQTSYADDSLVIINGSSVFFYVEGRKEEEYRVIFSNKAKGEPISGLPMEGEEFVAENYDTLADSPFMYGNIKVLKFKVSGKEHFISYYGKMIKPEENVLDDFKKIVIEEEKIFGELPYKKYIFMIVLVPDDLGGGLEHKNSTLIISNEHRLFNEFEYKLFLSTVSHEFFHTWNVKRIRPKELGPFDYTKEVYTDLLWFSEGFTSYYEWLVLLRAGIVTEKEYVDHIIEMINYYNFQPGHKKRSASSSSFNTWIKLYKPDGDLINNYISYYLKGELIAFAINNEIIKDTGFNKSLDDVFKWLYNDFKADGKGISFSELLKKVSDISSPRVSKILERLVNKTENEKFCDQLKELGYEIHFSYSDGRNIPRGFTGMVLQNSNGKIMVRYVLEDSPAFKSGILAGDEIVAVNNERFSEFFMRDFSKEMKQVKIEDLKEINPDEKVKIHIFRRNSLKEFEMIAEEEPMWLTANKKEDTEILKKLVSG
ncbi:MAG: M61 family metallopeptidase [Thermoplasmata archaeon]